MKALKETDFDFLGKPENPYLLGVKLERRECLHDKPRVLLNLKSLNKNRK
jgi:hypothetical protein